MTIKVVQVTFLAHCDTPECMGMVSIVDESKDKALRKLLDVYGWQWQDFQMSSTRVICKTCVNDKEKRN